MSDLSKELRDLHWCGGEEWTCTNCLAADEIETLERRVLELESFIEAGGALVTRFPDT